MGELEVQIQVFLTLVLVGDEWLASSTNRFTPWKRPQYPLDRRFHLPHSQLFIDIKKKLSRKRLWRPIGL
jgi:hypothetical protein